MGIENTGDQPGGTPPGDTPEPQVDPQTPKPQEPQEPQDTPDELIPEQYQGKDAKELVKILVEREKHIGEQSKQIGDLRNDVESFRYQQEERKRAEQEKQKPQEPQWTKEDEDRFYDNPRKFMNEEMAKFYQGVRYVRVPHDLQEARKQAYRQNAETFKGIEKEVDWLVEQSLRTGAVMPERANDPANYFRAATLIRAEREGFTPQSQRTNVNPVNPVDGEMPAGVKPDKPTKAPVHISDDMKKMVEYLGDGEVSLEDAAEMARGERRKREEMAK